MKVSQSPHLHAKDSVSGIMLLVFVALIPAALAGVWIFGFRAALVLMVSMASCVLSEFAWQKLAKKPVTVNDYSALVTGLLLGLNMPATIPLWMVLLGSVFAIVVVKQLFGGIGQNFMNPALAARAFLLASWPEEMTHWAHPFSQLFVRVPDGISGATPLAENAPDFLLSDLFLGNIGGCIGEVCKPAILIGAIFLLCKKVISPVLPLTYLGTMMVIGTLAGDHPLMVIFSGGVMLGAFFMATDYVTSPVTKKGQVIAGLFCGGINCLIRYLGAYPEGCTYAILLMNIVTPLIDRITAPRVFGEVGAWQKLCSRKKTK